MTRVDWYWYVYTHATVVLMVVASVISGFRSEYEIAAIFAAMAVPNLWIANFWERIRLRDSNQSKVET